MKIFLCGIFCLSIFLLPAQEPMLLSLDNAVSYAVDHNRSLLGSRYAVDKSAEAIKGAISAGLPQINASLDYTTYLGASASIEFSPGAPAVEIEFNPTSNLQLSVSQLLFNGNYWVGIELAKLAKTITEQSYQRDELNVREQVVQAYYMVLGSQRILGILRENKSNAETIFQKTTNLANAGVIEQTDARRLSIMVTSIENAIKSTERQIELGYNLLRLQLGLEPDQPIALSTSFDDIAGQYILPAQALDTFNIQNNLDYRLVSMQGKIAEENIRMAKSSYLPTLAAFYSYTEKIKKSAFDVQPKNILGLTLSIPIFSGGQRWTQLSQAKIDYLISENTRTVLEDQLTVAEKQLRYNYNNLLEQLQAQRENVEIAREVLEKMNLKYQQGVVSSLELTSSNSDYLNAESNYTGILLQLLNAELSLRKINNKL